jgi:RNA polymerase-binding transcription factor DksA
MKSQTSSKKTEPTHDFEIFRKRLMDELKSYQDRVNRARQELPVDSDPEDDAGVASRSAYREVTMGKLERDVQTIVEIERALSRLDAGQYATCVGCQSRIPDARLRAIPWTRTCIQCAGRSLQFASPRFLLNPNLAQ